MNLSAQLATSYILVFILILLIVNFIVLRLKKVNWKTLLGWKILIIALFLTLSGWFYSETSMSKDWLIKSYGFPKYFYLEKTSNEQSFVVINIIRFDYINFIQNFMIIFLLINLFWLIFKKCKTSPK